MVWDALGANHTKTKTEIDIKVANIIPHNYHATLEGTTIGHALMSTGGITSIKRTVRDPPASHNVKMR